MKKAELKINKHPNTSYLPGTWSNTKISARNPNKIKRY